MTSHDPDSYSPTAIVARQEQRLVNVFNFVLVQIKRSLDKLELDLSRPDDKHRISVVCAESSYPFWMFGRVLAKVYTPLEELGWRVHNIAIVENIHHQPIINLELSIKPSFLLPNQGPYR